MKRIFVYGKKFGDIYSQKKHKCQTFFVVFLFLASLLIVINFEEVKGETKNGYTSHEPISIIDDSEFTSTNGVSSGDGSQENPYIIEDWNISAKNKHAIQMRNTDKYFVIRNCYLHDGRSSYDGIYFENVKNGKIENCKFEKNSYSIWFVLSNNNVIIDNQIKNSGYGILLSSSTNNNITNNIIEENNNGIELYTSPYNIVMNNNVNDNLVGIDIAENNISYLGYSSKNNTIISNNISHNAYGIYLGSSNNKIYLNNFINNTNQAYDNGTNFWNSTNKGNYWSDYGGWVRELNETDTATSPSGPNGTVSTINYTYNVKENAVESYINLTSLNKYPQEDLDLTIYNPKGDVAGQSAGPNANEQVHLKRKDMQRGGNGEWEIEIQVFSGGFGSFPIDYQITVDVFYNRTDSNNDSIGDNPYFINGGNNKDNYPLISQNPNAGVQKQQLIKDKEENKQEFPYLYESLAIIIEIIIIATILTFLYLYWNRKPKKVVYHQFSSQIEKHPFATYQQNNIPYSHPDFYEEYYKQKSMQTTCPNCQKVFQINSLQKETQRSFQERFSQNSKSLEIECPYCKTKGVLK